MTDIFVNFPYDRDFDELFDALCFGTFLCGFRPRCAGERSDSGELRMQKIFSLINRCHLSIHDLSRIGLAPNGIPRFNMPFELGIFLGAKEFTHRDKSCMICVTKRDRHYDFISDLSGYDVFTHAEKPTAAMFAVRDWLAGRVNHLLPGHRAMQLLYALYREDLPMICNAFVLEETSLLYTDRIKIIETWIKTAKQHPKERLARLTRLLAEKG